MGSMSQALRADPIKCDADIGKPVPGWLYHESIISESDPPIEVLELDDPRVAITAVEKGPICKSVLCENYEELKNETMPKVMHTHAIHRDITARLAAAPHLEKLLLNIKYRLLVRLCSHGPMYEAVYLRFFAWIEGGCEGDPLFLECMAAGKISGNDLAVCFDRLAE